MLILLGFLTPTKKCTPLIKNTQKVVWSRGNECILVVVVIRLLVVVLVVVVVVVVVVVEVGDEFNL